jgi:FAD/FMN-containing dehydrogenase
VTAAEIVTADGLLRRFDDDHDPDLFWAIRGGGGSFGVVTALEFRLFPITEVVAGALRCPAGRQPRVPAGGRAAASPRASRAAGVGWRRP